MENVFSCVLLQVCIWKQTAICECACMQLYLGFGWLILRPHLQQIFSHIRKIVYDSNHFAFSDLNRWSVLYSEIISLVNSTGKIKPPFWGEEQKK